MQSRNNMFICAFVCLSCVADLPTDLLTKIVKYTRSNVRAIGCVNVLFSSICILPQFTKLIHFYPFNPWWFYVAKYHSKEPTLTWQEQCRAYDLWHNIFYNGDEDHDLIMQFRDVFDLDVVD